MLWNEKQTKCVWFSENENDQSILKNVCIIHLCGCVCCSSVYMFNKMHIQISKNYNAFKYETNIKYKLIKWSLNNVRIIS